MNIFIGPVPLVPTFETCRRLAAAGFPPTTYFVWEGEHRVKVSREEHGLAEPYVTLRNVHGTGRETFAAPTLAEVLEQLPPTLPYSYGWLLYLDMEKQDDGRFRFGYLEPVRADVYEHAHEGENAAETAAWVWLALVEAGHVKPAEVSP